MRKSLSVILFLIWCTSIANEVTVWNNTRYVLTSKQIDNYGVTIGTIPTIYPQQKWMIHYVSQPGTHRTAYRIFYIKNSPVLGVEFFYHDRDMIRVYDFTDRYSQIYYDMFRKEIIVSDIN